MIATEIRGIDLSYHQKAGKVDFKKLKASGYDFVMLRAGYGMYPAQKDKAFDSHYSAAKNAGLKVGAYHYSYAVTEDEAKREAGCFLNWIKDKKLDYPAAFDIEDKCQKTLGRERCTDIALAWLEAVEAAGYYTMLYSYADFIKNRLDMDRLRHFDVWLACYTSKEQRDKLYTHPILGIWQTGSDTKIPGVYSGRLDSNVAYKDYGAIIKRAGLNVRR